MKSIIRRIYNDESNQEVLSIMSEVTGKKAVPNFSWYENIETGDLYWDICGSISWPAKVKEREGDILPGCAVIIAARKGDNTFHVLEVFEEQNPQTLVVKCIQLRRKYGCGEYGDLLTAWTGDPSRYTNIINGINEILEKKGQPYFVLTMPLGRRVDDYDFFARTTYSALMPDSKGRKRLFIGKSQNLKNRIQDPVRGAKAILALGYAVHGLQMLRPWETPTNTKPDHYINFNF